jgi:hypothetical protein
VAQAQIIQDKVSRDAAVAAAEAAMAMSKIMANKELVATKAAQENNKDDKICMMMTRLACNRAIESSYWTMDNNLVVGLLTGYVLYRLPIELKFMDLDTFSR